jgi:hypothetical protein
MQVSVGSPLICILLDKPSIQARFDLLCPQEGHLHAIKVLLCYQLLIKGLFGSPEGAQVRHEGLVECSRT